MGVGVTGAGVGVGVGGMDVTTSMVACPGCVVSWLPGAGESNTIISPGPGVSVGVAVCSMPQLSQPFPPLSGGVGVGVSVCWPSFPP